MLKDAQPDEQAFLTISHEVALVSDPEGSVRWADARAQRVLLIQPGVSFLSLAAPGAEDKARRFLETACTAPRDVWELFIQVDGAPRLTAWRGAPTPDGALLVGSLLPQYYAEPQERVNAAMGDLATLQRETERQRRQLAEAHVRNESLLRAERVARHLVEGERRRLQQVLDSLPEGIVIVDSEGRYTVSNAAAVFSERFTPIRRPWKRMGARRGSPSTWPRSARFSEVSPR